MKQYSTLIILVLFTSTASCAVVHGTVYDWPSLQPLKNAIVEVNSTPVQQMVASAGNYSFFLPAGSYELSADYVQQDQVVLTAEENITIQTEGSFVLDLIMFPTLENLEELFDETEVMTQKEVFPPEADMLAYAALAGLVLIVIGVFALRAYLRRCPRKRRDMARSAAKKAKREPLPEDAKKVLEIIRREGRVTQKELRKQLPYSEAKASLIIAELEHRGLVKKFKRGRGNILRAA